MYRLQEAEYTRMCSLQHNGMPWVTKALILYSSRSRLIPLWSSVSTISLNTSHNPLYKKRVIKSFRPGDIIQEIRYRAYQHKLSVFHIEIQRRQTAIQYFRIIRSQTTLGIHRKRYASRCCQLGILATNQTE